MQTVGFESARLGVVLLALALPLLLLTRAVADDVPTTQVSAGDRAFAVLADFIGHWRYEGVGFANQGTLKVRETIEWSAGRKFIRIATYVTKPDGTEYQRYDALWGVKDGHLVATSYNYRGDVESSSWILLDDGKTLEGVSGEGKQKIRQHIAIDENRRMHWQVWMGDESEWKQIMDARWERADD